MLFAGRIFGLLLLVAAGLVVGRLYDLNVARWLATFWLPISAAAAFALAFFNARPVDHAGSRYESPQLALSGGRILIGVVAAASSVAASLFLLAVGIMTR
ncbi:MAG: hypothetical protein Q7J26_16725 [Brevundimonas sp.]|uniref:hypothetical protein n=1 Tax=Brevundimonas sp. TaxID=1871086 RepID=UPI00271F8BDC|nr:hypothetical protein [Brevundimonas sp.]MDO9610166.1 hypothetical protein [Brevundimonas sp.]